MAIDPEQQSSLQSDFEKVHIIDRDNAFFVQNLLTEPPDTESIIEWFHKQDPLMEGVFLSQLDALQTGDSSTFDRAIEHSVVTLAGLEHAAATLVADVYMPDSLADGQGSIIDIVDRLYEEKYPEHVDSPDNLTGPDDIMLVSRLEKTDHEYTLDDVQKLFVAAEMFLAASASFVAKSSLSPEGEIHIENNPQRAMVNRAYAGQLLIECQVAAYKLAKVDPRARLLGLQIYAQSLAMSMADNFYAKQARGTADKNVRDKTLGSYINLLETEFVGPDRLQTVDFEGTSVKGLMHEAIFILDMMILREITGQDYMIYPSMSNQDQPWLDYPRNNRGFDFMLVSQSGEKSEIALQLKSSERREKKAYHPSIKVLYEKNFMDYDQRRINAKIRAYRKLIAGSFNKEDSEKALSYVLDTAQEASEIYSDTPALSKDNIVRHIAERSGIDISSMQPQSPRPNRAERRAKKFGHKRRY